MSVLLGHSPWKPPDWMNTNRTVETTLPWVEPTMDYQSKSIKTR